MNRKVVRILSVLAAPVLLFIVFKCSAPGFGLGSIYITLSQTMLPLVIGYGLVFCMVTGIFDLSVGSKVVFSAAIGGILCNSFGIVGLVLGSVVSGLVVGAIMGAMQNAMRIPSLVLSLGVVMLLEVASNAFLGRGSYLQISAASSILGTAPYNILLAGLLGVLCYLIYYNSRFAFHARMVGNNEVLAKNMGINPRKITLQSYVVAGLFYGFAGIMLISYSGAVSATLGMNSLSMVFQPMMGVMVGIEMMAVVDNILFNVFIGEFCIAIIFNGLIAIGLPATMQNVALGIFILMVMMISGNKDRITAFARQRRINAGGGPSIG